MIFYSFLLTVFRTFTAMLPISVVVLTKNEATRIEACLEPWLSVCQEVLVVDNGSTDDTLQVAKRVGARVLTTSWKGYSETKNEANTMATHDWILSLDADEVANPVLLQSVKAHFQQIPSQQTVFTFRRKLMYKNRLLNYGSVRKEIRKRLFHRKHTQWNNQAVHEDVELTPTTHCIPLDGYVTHYSYESDQDHWEKLQRYAQLQADDMFRKGKKYTLIKAYISPVFGWIKNILFRLGFLDGSAGFQLAKMNMRYTALKYRLLQKKYIESGTP